MPVKQYTQPVSSMLIFRTIEYLDPELDCPDVVEMQATSRREMLQAILYLDPEDEWY